MAQTRMQRLLALGVLAAVALPNPAGAQKRLAAPVLTAPGTVVEETDAQHTKDELSNLLDRHAPALRRVLQLDPSLLNNEAYLAPYPSLVNYLNAHPEIARNPEFFIGAAWPNAPRDHESQIVEMWRDTLAGVAVFIGFGMAIGLIIWLIRTLIDYRRWTRLSKVQTEVHTKLLDRFTGNEDLLAYIQSPAGAKFLESSPINLDFGPRTVGAPLGRILWSGQAGIVLVAAGIGLWVVSARIATEASQPFHAMGILAMALGIGLVISAIISYMISNRLGLIEKPAQAQRLERPAAQM